MPIYEYRCPKGHEFEVLHRMDDPPPESCDVCGASPVERVFRPVPIFFKGSGFYTTDYGHGKRKVETGGDGAKSGGEGSKAADKPADKSEKSAKAADA
jgi:putative FmdB family regulatory protein